MSINKTRPLARQWPRAATGTRSKMKRDRIVETAMRHFADHGFYDARIEDISAELKIAKGSIFQHFKSKAGLFLECYMRATRSFPSYLDAPADVLAAGFFPTLRYWLRRTDHLIREDWLPYRVSLLGNYGTDLNLRREINRFLTAEDPYRISAFIRFGIDRGEVRSDVDPRLLVSIVDWTMERFQDTLLTEALDPGLLRRSSDPDAKEAQIAEFLKVLQGAIGTTNRDGSC